MTGSEFTTLYERRSECYRESTLEPAPATSQADAEKFLRDNDIDVDTGEKDVVRSGLDSYFKALGYTFDPPHR